MKKIYDLLYKDFCKKKPSGETDPLQAVRHKDGRIYASDGYVLARVDRSYPAELEGKAIMKDGMEIESNAHYESVIPSTYSGDKSVSGSLDMAELRKAVTNIRQFRKNSNYACIDLIVSPEREDDKRIVFKAFQLYNAFRLFDLLKEDFSVRIYGRRPNILLFESLFESGSLVLISPVYCEVGQTDVPVFTPSEALDYEKPKPETKKNWYETEI